MHMPYWEETFRNAIRHLKPNGVIVSITLDTTDDSNFSYGQLLIDLCNRLAESNHGLIARYSRFTFGTLLYTAAAIQINEPQQER